MDKIRILDKEYEINSIAYNSEGNLLAIEFVSEVPKSSYKGIFELLTESGTVYADIEGYDTIYKIDDNVVILSNDNSIYPETFITVDTSTDSIELSEEQKAEKERQNKINEVNSQIYAIDNEFKDLDYIGIKIATGRATIDEYTEEIARMTELADKKNELENELKELQEVND